MNMNSFVCYVFHSFKETGERINATHYLIIAWALQTWKLKELGIFNTMKNEIGKTADLLNWQFIIYVKVDSKVF